MPETLTTSAELANDMEVSVVSLSRYISDGRIEPDFVARRPSGSVLAHLFNRDHAEAIVAWFRAHRELHRR